MGVLQKRAVAWCLAAVMALGSVVGLGGMKLHAQRREAVEAFTTGKDGFSAYSDLQNRSETAYNLITMAGQVLEADDQSLQAAAKAWEAMEKAERPEEYGAANSALQGAIDNLYQAMAASGRLDDRQQALAKGQYANFESRRSNLKFDDYYNDKAEAYNKACSGFPAGLIAGLTGNGKLPVFR